MDVSSFVLVQALKQLKIPSRSIRQLQIAGELSNVDGNGFPAELFQLSAPMVTRGLLNYAILQMKRDWMYPFWVNLQLDPKSESFIARSQNPLLLNTTHRNWTLLGSPNGIYEAIVDPRGLVTPLPREWSVDVWIVTDAGILFPSLCPPSIQDYNTQAPRITTRFNFSNHIIELEAFVDTSKQGIDILFHKIHIINKQTTPSEILVCIAIRPFNPEGVAPIQHIEYRHSRYFYIDRSLGLVLAEEPLWVVCSNAENGDTVNLIKSIKKSGKLKNVSQYEISHTASCKTGLANAVAIYSLSVQPGESKFLHYSTALGTKEELSHFQPKSTWRVSFEKRSERHRSHWSKERSFGGKVTFADDRLQKIFDANVLTLLQLDDGDFISPGPFLYHHFWFRDAVPMIYALDRLGFHKRTQQVIDSFTKRLTREGFFRGPDGEWDSNGEVLWLIEQYIKFTHSNFWLKNIFPVVLKAAEWIIRKRKSSRDSKTTHSGLMPPSLSAEHLGTVDQYYWDSFWSYAGIRSAGTIAQRLHKNDEAEMFEKELTEFQRDIQKSLDKSAERLGQKLIPASPTRSFDESAIGSVCGIYPLKINDLDLPAFKNTLEEIVTRYVDEKGFYHPIIHSGYNAYLTFHLAHAYLFQNESEKAWNVAEKIFKQCVPPYSLPEAIHPRTGGGSMGDGHHGWAAAEIVIFLLDCIVRERGNILQLFKDAHPGILTWGKNTFIGGLATSFGKINCTLNYETDEKAICSIGIEGTTEIKPEIVELYLPFSTSRVLSINPRIDVQVAYKEGKTYIRCSSANATLLLEK